MGSAVSALTYQNNVNVSFTFNPTVSITLSGSDGTNLVIGKLAPGSASDSNIITVTAGTNAVSGYNLTVSAGSTDSTSVYYNSNALKNGSSTMASLSNTASSLNAITAGEWGYSYCLSNNDCTDDTYWVSGNSGSTSMGYAGLPAINGTAVTLASPNTNATSTIEFKIAARASDNQVSGTYSNIVNFAAIAKPITTNYTITYNDATGTATNLPSTSESGVISSGNTANVALSSIVPTRRSYEFKGWCTVTTTTDACTGNIYEKGSTYIVGNIGGTVTIPLYAIWKKLPVYMQDLTLADCMQNVGTNGNATNIGDEITVFDKRKDTGANNYAADDDGDYTIRYINGECWMTQNLRITGTISADDSNFSGNDFNVSEYSLDSGDSSYTNHCDTTNGYNYACAKNSGNTSQGVWYNYAAASAGTITTDSNDTVATSDICPAGWHLPSSPSTTANTDFNKLVGNTTSGYQAATAGLTAFSAVAGGGYGGGSLLDGIGYGIWWSATAYNTTRRYDLAYDSSNGQFYGNDYSYRYRGFFVRCVKSSDGYMQDQTASTLATLMPNVGSTTTLTDKRDNQEYTVAKLADEKYWMTKNLNLAGGTAISCDTSDCENYTISTTNRWQSGGKLPASSTSGFNTNNYAYVYNSGSTTCGSNSPCYSYYSWDAATLGSGRNITTDNTDAPYSICPKGWKLPTTYEGTNATTDFRALLIAYGGFDYIYNYTSSTNPTGAILYSRIGSGTTSNFVLSGSYYNSSFRDGGSGSDYWTATADSSIYGHNVYISQAQIHSANYGLRQNGNAVRCLFRS